MRTQDSLTPNPWLVIVTCWFCKGQVNKQQPSQSPGDTPRSRWQQRERMGTQELGQNICLASPDPGGQSSQSPLRWEVSAGAHRNPPYLCLMELPRSLRGICGDQRGTESVSAGRDEEKSMLHRGPECGGSSQALEGRRRLAGFRKDSGRRHHLLNQSQTELCFNVCQLDFSKVPWAGHPGSALNEVSCGKTENEHCFHLWSAWCGRRVLTDSQALAHSHPQNHPQRQVLLASPPYRQ